MIVMICSEVRCVFELKSAGNCRIFGVKVAFLLVVWMLIMLGQVGM